MSKLKEAVIHLFEHFSAKELVLSIITGFFFASLITIPFFAAWINLVLIYIRQLYFYLFLMNGTVSLFLVLWVKFSYETLYHYRPEDKKQLKKLMMIESLVLALLSFIIGTIIILTVTPNLL